MHKQHDDATARAIERVAKARAELILARTFYGVLVSQVEPVPSRAFPTMATNGKRHFFNPDFVATLSQNELLAVQAHESEHDARRHHTRRGGRDPKEWNIATDYAINIDLVDQGFKLAADALVDEKYRGLSAEDIYRMRELDRQREQPKGEAPEADEGDDDDGLDEADTDPGRKPGDESDDDADSDDAENGDGDEGDGDDSDDEGEGEGEGEGSDESDDGDDGEGQGSGDGDDEADKPGKGKPQDGQESAAGEPNGEPGDGSQGDPEASQHPASSGDPGRCGEVLDAADAESDPATVADQDARWERVLRQAAMLATKRGDAPGHVSREIERADHPPKDWRETLRAFFDGGAATRETWSRPNRRFIGGGIYLPGREREGLNRAAILVDTSGSMDTVALAAIGVEIQAALDERIIDELVVIYGDTRVTRVDTYQPGDEVEFDPRGGGGTVLAPLFKHVADEVDASLIVCFTDGYIDITSYSGHPEPASPVLWAFTGYPQAVRQHIANAPWGAAAIDVGSH
jgi:predicted metal-dependent peptidase